MRLWQPWGIMGKPVRSVPEEFFEVCPVEAIYYEDDTPEEWAEYYKANVEFFDVLGSPGGAAKIGNTHTDHPIIAALPPQNQD